VESSSAVAFEDSVAGVRAAAAAGIGRVIGVTTTSAEAALRAAGAHETVDTLTSVAVS
jgi:sugar-phosphatase